MNLIYTSENYIIFEYSTGKQISFSRTSNYQENVGSFTMRESFSSSNFSIPFAQAGTWYDATGTIAFTEATLRTFLRTNTGFKTVAGSSVTLPSIYTGDGTISGASRNVTVGDAGGDGYGLNFQVIGDLDKDSSIEIDSDSIDFSTNKNGNITFTSVNNVDNSDFTSSTGISFDSDIFVLAREVGDGVGGVSTTQNITLDAAGMVVEDSTNSKGLEYAADYSAQYTDRSIVDKAYVDANGGGSAAGSNTQIQYNDNGEFGASGDFSWNDGSKTFAVKMNSGTTYTNIKPNEISAFQFGGDGFKLTENEIRLTTSSAEGRIGAWSSLASSERVTLLFPTTGFGDAVDINVPKISGDLGIVNGYTLPTSDGSANQVMSTDGNGVLTFEDASEGIINLTIGTVEPVSPAVGDFWADTN